MAKQGETVMGIEEVGKYLHIPKSTVYKLAQEGKQWRFLRSAVDEWLSEANRMESENEKEKRCQLKIDFRT